MATPRWFPESKASTRMFRWGGLGRGCSMDCGLLGLGHVDAVSIFFTRGGSRDVLEEPMIWELA